jgi:NIPSNAP
MIYELRVYKCAKGRLNDVIKRFENPVLPVWKEIGIEPIGFWTSTAEGQEEVVYIIPWNSDAERAEKMGKFAKDPRWLEAKQASEANGPIVVSFSSTSMNPTTFSDLQ